MGWKPPQLPSLRGSDSVPLRQIFLHLSDYLDGLGGSQQAAAPTVFHAESPGTPDTGTLISVGPLPAGEYRLDVTVLGTLTGNNQAEVNLQETSDDGGASWFRWAENPNDGAFTASYHALRTVLADTTVSVSLIAGGTVDVLQARITATPVNTGP